MPVRAALPPPPSHLAAVGGRGGGSCRASYPAFTVGLMPKSCVPPPPPPQAGSWLLWGETGGERAEEARLSPGALGEGLRS